MPAAPSVCPVQHFGGAGARAVVKQIGDDLGFDLVVLLARGAMHVDVIDILGLQLRAPQRIVQSEPRTDPFGMRRRHVMRVVGLAIAQQPRAALRLLLQQREAGRFSEIDAPTLAHRTAGIARATPAPAN